MPSTPSKDRYTIAVAAGGLTLVAPGPLTRPHYFDGKRLTAADLNREQSALRAWSMLAHQAGGAGVVHGFDCDLVADRLELGRGLAVDPQGRLLLLPDPATVSLDALLDAARGDADRPPATRPAPGRFTACDPVRVAPPPGVAVDNVELWLLTLAHAEAPCGTEDVFGDPCERACVTATGRPYIVEGVLLRAVPLVLESPLPTAAAVALTRLHLRSRIAAAYFADDRRRVRALIDGPGLRADAWCLGARLAGGRDVPIAVLARAAGETLFLDPWIPRRERIDPPPRTYWAARLAMRPWSDFLAEVSQFQCHLRDLLAGAPERQPVDPCARTRAVLRRTSAEVRRLFDHYAAISERLVDALSGPQPDLTDALERLKSLHHDLDEDAARDAAEPLDRLLIHGGIVELPPAGYLPVVPGRDPSVELQVRRWLGDGVDLRFCIVRPDFVAHALEEVQHMERISLIAGLDDPGARPEVDILVPDGRLVSATGGVGVEFTAQTFRPGHDGPVVLLHALPLQTTAGGAGRAERLPDGGGVIHLAGQLSQPGLRAFLTAALDRHPGDAAVGDRIPLRLRLVTAVQKSQTLVPHLDLELAGSLHITAIDARIHAELTYVAGDGPSAALPLELSWKPAPPGFAAAELSVRRPGPAPLDLVLALRWSRSAPHDVTATFAVTGQTAGNPHQLLTEVHAAFRTSAAVLDPASQPHAAALAVVADIARARKDPGFEQQARALLFPPPPARAELLAARDWVLFHRRRTRQCLDRPEPRPPIRPPVYRTYRLYAAPLDGRRPALPALLGNLDPRSFIELGTTRFLDDAEDLRPPELTALEGMRPQLPQGFNVLGAATFSAHTAQDGELRLIARTRAVAGVLTPRPPDAPELFVHLLAEPPANTSQQGIDGLIILAGLARTASTRANIYWVDPRQLPKLGARTNLATFLKASKSPHLGSVAFAAGAPTLLDIDPTALTKALADTPSFRTAPRDLVALVLCATDHPTDAVPALLADRAESLATALSLNDRLRDATGQLKPAAHFPPDTPIAILLSARLTS